MKSRRSYFPQILLCILLGITGLSAKDLVTKKGKVFRNYKIVRREGAFVIVNHESGGAKVRISDLPDDIARPYALALVKKEIAELREEEDLEKRERRLLKLKTQYPAARNMIEDELAQIQDEKEFEKDLAEAVSAEPIQTRVKKLQTLQDIYRDTSWAKERIELEINKAKNYKFEKDLAEAVSSEPIQERIRNLQALQDIYRDTAGAKERIELEIDKAKKAELAQKKREAVEIAMAEAKEAQTDEEAIDILEKIIARYPDAENIEQARKRCTSLKNKPLAKKYWEELLTEFPVTIEYFKASGTDQQAASEFVDRLIKHGERAVFISENLELSTTDQIAFLIFLFTAKYRVDLAKQANKEAVNYEALRDYSQAYKERQNKNEHLEEALKSFREAVKLYNKGL